MRFKEFIELDEILSVKARRKKARQMKRLRKPMAIKRKRALKRAPNKEVVTKRARRQARSQLYKKLSRGKSSSDLSLQRRASIEKRLKRFSRQVDRLATRKVPYARKLDRERRSKS